MKDDLDKYISRRKRRDGKFAGNFESGYQEFKVGVLLRQARTKELTHKQGKHQYIHSYIFLFGRV